MRKILLPIDGSERSMKAIDWVESRYSPENVDITILIVREDLERPFQSPCKLKKLI
ncbi:MAG: universal stress protein [Lachnospiraceae bacterium]|nr:universal stress protein [Lachnospiraceae bacterium]